MGESHFAVGERVHGTYLRQPFTGTIKDVGFETGLADVRSYHLVFDAPVEVARPPLSNKRSNVRLLLDADGESVDRKGRKDGLASVRR
jgi:hypothetical protein